LPSFTSSIPNLQAVGPLIELQVAVGSALESTFKAGAEAIPGPVKALAMIDTGASVSVLRQGLAAQLSLNAIGVSYINTPSSTNVPCYRYLVRFIFPNEVLVETNVVEAPLQGQNIQCLIGRDVLAHGVLIYIGGSNLFSLSL